MNKLNKSVLKKTFPFLKIISQLPLSDRKKILKHSKGDKLIHKSLRELAYNYLKGNLKTKKQPKKSDILFMRNLVKKENTSKKCSCAKRAKHLQKGAGILSLLIPAVATLVSSLVSRKS